MREYVPHPLELRSFNHCTVLLTNNRQRLKPKHKLASELLLHRCTEPHMYQITYKDCKILEVLNDNTVKVYFPTTVNVPRDRYRQLVRLWNVWKNKQAQCFITTTPHYWREPDTTEMWAMRDGLRIRLKDHKIIEGYTPKRYVRDSAVKASTWLNHRARVYDTVSTMLQVAAFDHLIESYKSREFRSAKTCNLTAADFITAVAAEDYPTIMNYICVYERWYGMDGRPLPAIYKELCRSLDRELSKQSHILRAMFGVNEVRGGDLVSRN